MLLRHDRRHTGKSSWTAAYERYLSAVSFDHPAQEIAFVEYRRAISEAQARVRLLTQALTEQLEHWRMRPLVRALMTLRGVDEVVAISLVAELGELKRFAHPRDLMGYLGLAANPTTAHDPLLPVATGSFEGRQSPLVRTTQASDSSILLVNAARVLRYRHSE